jgi:hypothetical protein
MPRLISLPCDRSGGEDAQARAHCHRHLGVDRHSVFAQQAPAQQQLSPNGVKTLAPAGAIKPTAT